MALARAPLAVTLAARRAVPPGATVAGLTVTPLMTTLSGAGALVALGVGDAGADDVGDAGVDGVADAGAVVALGAGVVSGYPPLA